MDFEQAPEHFGHVIFNRTDRDTDAQRFYMIAWQSTLLDNGAVVRTFGRKGRWKRVITTPIPRCRLPGRSSGRQSKPASATATASLNPADSGQEKRPSRS